MSVSEILRILHHGDASHSYDHGIGTRVQSTGGNNPMVDMMKRAGRVFLATDHSYRTWNEKRGAMSETVALKSSDLYVTLVTYENTLKYNSTA